jgi:hypothetical protein
MKTPNVTRLLIGSLPGESKPDHALARRQISAGTKPSSKAQAAAELEGFKRNISKMSARQLKDLHARLSKRLGKVKLAQIMSEAKAKR